MSDPIRTAYYELCRLLDIKLEHLRPRNHVGEGTDWKFLDDRIYFEVMPGKDNLAISITADDNPVVEEQVDPNNRGELSLPAYMEAIAQRLHETVKEQIKALS